MAACCLLLTIVVDRISASPLGESFLPVRPHAQISPVSSLCGHYWESSNVSASQHLFSCKSTSAFVEAFSSGHPCPELCCTFTRSTMWYTREEQALVIGAFYSMNGFQQCVGGLIAYGIYHIQNAALKNWQILFTVRTSSLCRSCQLERSARRYRLNLHSFSAVSLQSGAALSCGGCLTPPCVRVASRLRTDCSWPSE